VKRQAKRQAWVWLVVAVVALVGAILVSRGASSRSSSSPPDSAQGARQGATSGGGSGRQRPVPTVAVGYARHVQLPRTLQLTASIGSLKQAVLLPKTSGYLQVVTVRSGDPVRAGQVVAIVDHAQLDAQLAQAQAGLAAAQSAVETARAQVAVARAQRLNQQAQVTSAQANLAKAQAQLVDAQRTFARSQTLAQQGAVSQQSLDDAKMQVGSAQAGVDAARAQVTQAEAQVDAARQQEAAAASLVRTQQAQVANQAAQVENARLGLQSATIVAPFGGMVITRALDPGAYVTPGISTPILTIADLDNLDVLVNIAEADLSHVHPGDRTQIHVDAYPDRTFQGAVSRIGGGVDPMTRTAQVEIDVPNPGHLLRPGMYATVQLAAGSQPALVVPLSALVTVGGQHFVWVVTDGKVSQQPVTVGQATGVVVEITNGLTDQDVLVFRGTDLVREGQSVRSVPVTQ